MSLNIKEMAEEVCLNLGLRPVDGLSTAEKAQLVKHMNFAQRLITRMANPVSLQGVDNSVATVAGTESYLLPVAIKVVYNVRLFETAAGLGYNIEMETPFNMDMRVPNPAIQASGIPTRAYVWDDGSGTNIKFNAKPDKVYEVQIRFDGYSTVITDVEDETNVSLVGYDDVIIAGATMYGFSARREWRAKGEWRAEFRTLLKSAQNSDGKLGGWRPVMQGFGGQAGRSLLHIDDYDFPTRV